MKKTTWTLLVCLLLGQATAAKKINHNYLSTLASQQPLQELVQPGADWVDFPSYQDRAAWERLPPTVRAKYIKKGEQYLNYTWPAIPLSSYQDFVRTGDRQVQQRPYNARKQALLSLFFAELMEGEGRFMDQLINGVWTVCEQTYWGISAHLTLQKNGAGVPDINDPTIDLAAGGLGANMAWIYYFMHQVFDKFNPLVSKRMVYEIQRQIIEPYYSRDDFRWMAFYTDFANNWNPWCNYNALLCALLVETNPMRLASMVEKSMRSVDKFINYYHQDGGCEEGPSYWIHAGGMLYAYLDLLAASSKGKLSIFDKPLVRNIGSYLYKAYITSSYFINFADASAEVKPDARTVYEYGKHTQDTTLMQFGAMLAQRTAYTERIFVTKIEKALKNLFIAQEITQAKAHEPLIADFWMSGTQIAGARDVAGSTEGFYFAAKGGFNKESHNHNDVGTFILYYDGAPCLVDAGVGTYTRKTFSSKRYEIWSMKSQYHNLPLINGVAQKEGKKYKALNCKFQSTPQRVTFGLELAKAYPKAAGIESWHRKYELERGKKFVLEDQFELQAPSQPNQLHFLTVCQVSLKKPGLLRLRSDKVDLLLSYDSTQFDYAVETIEIDDPRMVRSWGTQLYQLKLKAQETLESGKYRIKIVEGNKP